MLDSNNNTSWLSLSTVRTGLAVVALEPSLPCTPKPLYMYPETALADMPVPVHDSRDKKELACHYTSYILVGGLPLTQDCLHVIPPQSQQRHSHHNRQDYQHEVQGTCESRRGQHREKGVHALHDLFDARPHSQKTKKTQYKNCNNSITRSLRQVQYSLCCLGSIREEVGSGISDSRCYLSPWECQASEQASKYTLERVKCARARLSTRQVAKPARI